MNFNQHPADYYSGRDIRNSKGWLTMRALKQGYTEQQAWDDEHGVTHIIEMGRSASDGVANFLVSHDIEATYEHPQGQYTETTHQKLNAARKAFDHERRDAS